MTPSDFEATFVKMAQDLKSLERHRDRCRNGTYLDGCLELERPKVMRVDLFRRYQMIWYEVYLSLNKGESLDGLGLRGIMFEAPGASMMLDMFDLLSKHSFSLRGVRTLEDLRSNLAWVYGHWFRSTPLSPMGYDTYKDAHKAFVIYASSLGMGNPKVDEIWHARQDTIVEELVAKTFTPLVRRDRWWRSSQEFMPRDQLENMRRIMEVIFACSTEERRKAYAILMYQHAPLPEVAKLVEELLPTFRVASQGMLSLAEDSREGGLTVAKVQGALGQVHMNQ